MQFKLFAENYEEFVFTDQLPDMLEQYAIPGAAVSVASVPFGNVLFQLLEQDGIVIRIQHYLLHQQCTLILLEYTPALKLRFHLNNHIKCHIEGLGNIIFYEQGYNLLYIPFRNSRLHFQWPGSYSLVDIHYPLQTLSKKLPPLILMNDFQQKVAQQQPAILIPVNQVADRHLLFRINQLLHAGKKSSSVLASKSNNLLHYCLQKIAEQPDEQPVTLSLAEAHAMYQARTLMQNNLQRHWTIKELTLLTGLSDYKLKTGFQQLYHSTPFDYLRDLRMEKAWQLLPGKKHTVSQVAKMVGYTNLSAFSKAFKKYHGITARKRGKEKG